MTVAEYINVLQKLPQHLEVMDFADEFCYYYPAQRPKIACVTECYSRISGEWRWEEAENKRIADDVGKTKHIVSLKGLY